MSGTGTDLYGAVPIPSGNFRGKLYSVQESSEYTPLTAGAYLNLLQLAMISPCFAIVFT